MTKEEKAKAYDEALARCKWQLANKLITEESATDLFRELAESEDEKIMKAIIQFFRDASNSKTRVVSSNTFAEWATYLENQKEQKPVE